MTQYRYKAKKGPTEFIEGFIEAESQDAAIHKISKRGIYPLFVQKAETLTNYPKALRPLLALVPKASIRLKDRLAFTRQLSDLLYGGLPLFQSLELLIQETENKSMKGVIEYLRDEVSEGVPLSTACSHFPKVFPPLYTSMIRAGEAGGMLDKVLERLAQFAEKEEETRSKIKTALAYPIFLAIVGAMTILVLLIFVIPKLTPVFEDFGQTLPLPTLLIVTLSQIILGYWWAVLLLGAGCFLLIRKNKWQVGKSILFDRLILQAPLLGPLLQKSEISRFARTLGTLLTNGIPILKSLEIVRDNLRNTLYKDEVTKMLDAITEGHKLGETLKESTLFPSTLSHMMIVGEETGNLESALLKIAETYDREVDRASQIFTSLLEPIMILLLGAIIAFIVISMLLPIFNLQMGVS